MRTSDEVVQHLQEIIASIYSRPAMYGEDVAGVEQALWIYHRTWAYVSEQDDKYFNALAEAGEAAGCGNMSFEWGYRNLHPTAPKREVLEFTLRNWATVTRQLGIPMPTDYPDPKLAFSANTGQPQGPPPAEGLA